MTSTQVAFLFVIMVVVLVIAGLIFLRIRVGSARSGSSLTQATRRNSLISALVIMLVLGFWIQRFTSGKYIEQGIVGWKMYAAFAVIGMGVLSVIFLLYSVIKR